MGAKGNLTVGGKCTIQYTDDVIEKSTPEPITLLSNVTPINSIQILKIILNLLLFNLLWANIQSGGLSLRPR